MDIQYSPSNIPQVSDGIGQVFRHPKTNNPGSSLFTFTFRERRLLFVEKISDRSTFRENLTKCALNRLAVPGVIFLSLPVAAVTCAGINSNTGLVAKLGWSSMTVSPVVHGVPLIWNERQSTIGGEYVASHFKKQTLVDNPEYGDLELHLFDDIIARLGYIRGLEHIDNPPQVVCKLL